MEHIDTQALAAHAVQQARLLAFEANVAADVAISQAVALLHTNGLSQRDIARLTGLSKSDVARKVKRATPHGIAPSPKTDNRVHAFAKEWIWGSAKTAHLVIDTLTRQRDNSEADGLIIMGEPRRGKTYPAAGAALFAADIIKIAANGGGQATLHTDDRQPLGSAQQAIDTDAAITEALIDVKAAGFTVTIEPDETGHHVTVRLTRSSDH